MRIVSGGLGQQVPDGPFLWPDLVDVVLAEDGILQEMFSHRPNSDVSGWGGYDLLRVACGVAISKIYLFSPPESYKAAIMDVMTHSGTVRAVCTFVDAAMESYQECLSDGSFASISPPPLSLASLTSCNQSIALSLLPWFLSLLHPMISMNCVKENLMNPARGTIITG